MITDPNTRAYMKVGDEWVELPRIDNGFAIDPPQALSNMEVLTIRYKHSLDDPNILVYVNYSLTDIPDGATITKASINPGDMPRGRFGDVWGLIRDEEE